MEVEIIRFLIHYSFHFLAPILIAKKVFPTLWNKAYWLMLSTMLIDLDHLLANPVFDANRCSIGYHPLHSIYAIVFFTLMLYYKHWITRSISIGYLWHIITDSIDCSFI